MTPPCTHCPFSPLTSARPVFPQEPPTHPTLAPGIALSLLPFRAFPPRSPPPPERLTALHGLAHSLLSVPDLLTSRLAPAQAAQLVSPAGPLPFWELVGALAGPDPARGAGGGPGGGVSPPALLAALAELALSGRRVTADKGVVPGAKEVREWMEVVRRGLGDLPRGVFDRAGEGDKGTGQAKVTEEVAEVEGDEDSEAEEVDDGAVERARKAVGAVGSSPAEDAQMSSAPSTSSHPAAAAAAAASLTPRTLRSLALLPSPSHLLTLLTLSTRHASTTRPLLSQLLTSLLSLLPPSPRSTALHTLLYAPGAAGFALPRELYRGYLRAGPLARALSAARERTQGVVAALQAREHADSGEWAVLLLVVELYSRALVTLGDDEFYASGSGSAAGAGAGAARAGRNPLSLDEVVGLSALARNVAFALYWSAGDTVVGAGATGVLEGREQGRRVVGGTGCSWEEVREVMTRFLQQVHARECVLSSLCARLKRVLTTRCGPPAARGGSSRPRGTGL